MQIPDEPTLKRNLLTALTRGPPQTDADAGSLADYVTALLRHDKPPDVLYTYCLEQLNEFFLPQKAAPFLTRLFQDLQSGVAFKPASQDPDDGDDKKKQGNRVRATTTRSVDALQEFEPLPAGSSSSMTHRHSPRHREELRSKRSHSKDFPNSKDSRDTIVVDRMPEGCQNDDLRTFFEDKFGPVLAVERVQPTRATVTFRDEDAAVRALHSPDAVLGNRFIKTFLAKKSRPSAAPSRLTRQQTRMVSSERVTERARLRQERLQGLLQMQRQKQELLSKYVEQQKQILAKLDDPSTATAERLVLKESLLSLDRSISELHQSSSTDDSARTLKERKAPPSSFKMDLRPGAFIMTPVPTLLRNDQEAFRKILAGYGASLTRLTYDAQTQSALVEYANRAEASKVL
jgi:hypothetical protein